MLTELTPLDPQIFLNSVNKSCLSMCSTVNMVLAQRVVGAFCIAVVLEEVTHDVTALLEMYLPYNKLCDHDHDHNCSRYVK